MSQRRRTAFADILREDPAAESSAESQAVEIAPPPAIPRLNKATSPAYTKLTAYIPRTLASAIKMSMALDQTADQSEYIEHILTEWLRTKGREAVLRQVGYDTAVL